MRVSVVIGKVKSGAWEVLALPDKDIEAQKRMVKDTILAHGVIGEGRKSRQFVELLRFEKYAKRARFNGLAPVVVSASE